MGGDIGNSSLENYSGQKWKIWTLHFNFLLNAAIYTYLKAGTLTVASSSLILTTPYASIFNELQSKNYVAENFTMWLLLLHFITFFQIFFDLWLTSGSSCASDTSCERFEWKEVYYHAWSKAVHTYTRDALKHQLVNTILPYEGNQTIPPVPKIINLEPTRQKTTLVGIYFRNYLTWHPKHE